MYGHTHYTVPYKGIWLFSVNKNTETIYPTSLEFENFPPLFLPFETGCLLTHCVEILLHQCGSAGLQVFVTITGFTCYYLDNEFISTHPTLASYLQEILWILINLFYP